MEVQSVQVAAVPGKRNPQLSATVVLSLATVVYFSGYVVMVFGVFGQTSVLFLAGVIVMAVGAVIYLPGLVVYRRNSGKPHFVGFVVAGQNVQLQQHQPQLFTSFVVQAGQSAQPPAENFPPNYDDIKKPPIS